MPLWHKKDNLPGLYPFKSSDDRALYMYTFSSSFKDYKKKSSQ